MYILFIYVNLLVNNIKMFMYMWLDFFIMIIDVWIMFNGFNKIKWRKWYKFGFLSCIDNVFMVF